MPSSAKRLDAFVKGWARPFGWPKMVAADRGIHNRGVFNQTLSKKGVIIRPAALGSPEQIGRVERRNQTLKAIAKKIIRETHAIGLQAMGAVLSESICAINEMARRGGFAPAQWVLAKYPRQPATLGDEDERADVGAIQARVDGPRAFVLQTEHRTKARTAFVEWGSGSRAQRGILRNAAPIPGP